MTAWKIAVAVVLAAALAGCLSQLERRAPHYHVLEAPGEPAKARATRAATLFIASTTAAGFYDAQPIAFSRQPGSRGYYQLNRWTERPSRRIHALLLERLRQSGGFEAVVGPSASGLRGDLVLETRLEELYHDAATRPGTARVTLSATLTDPAQRELVARRSFTRSAPAASYDAAGAVAGFNQAVGALLDDVVAWVDAEIGVR